MLGMLIISVYALVTFVHLENVVNNWHSKRVTLRTHSMQGIRTFDTLFPSVFYTLDITSLVGNIISLRGSLKLALKGVKC